MISRLPAPRLIWRIWVLGFLVLLMGVYVADSAWWLPSPPSRLVHSADRFLLPAPSEMPRAGVAEVVRQGALWGSAALTGSVTPEVIEPWEFSGTYFQGQHRVAIATWKSGLKPAQHLKVGDETPGGHKIIDIKEDRMMVRVGTLKNKQPMTLWILLHQTPPVTY